jgi:galactoside O-acetyltransferase
MDSFYSQNELLELGFKKIGTNVLISKKSSIYNAQNIEIGDNVRIDDFCLLSGTIKLGNYIHIGAYSALYAGNAGIEMMDFSGLSARVTIYAVSDDFSGNYLANSVVNLEYRNLISTKINIHKYSSICAGCTILPNSIINEGVVIGAMSMLKNITEPWSIYFGVPAKKIKNRSKKLLELEYKMKNNV